jgi:non-canonical (house-cleaning) NTP pyrophosphatase
MKQGTVAIGSESALKVRALKQALVQLQASATVDPLAVTSGVSDQPIGVEEITIGAYTRARNAYNFRSARPIIAIGIENGVTEYRGTYFDVPAVAAVTQDHEWCTYGSAIPLPADIARAVIDNREELGRVIWQYFPDVNEKDPVRALTGGALLREQVLSQALLLLLSTAPDQLRERLSP